METLVLIVGAGPTGLAVAACLNLASVANIVLERDDCLSPLWRKRTYNRLHLNLPKERCQLPNMPHPPSAPTYIPKEQFIQYMDDYASRFAVHPMYCREVLSASYDASTSRWRVKARNVSSGEAEEYVSRFLVVASGQNDVAFVPKIPGIDTFPGDRVHSSLYRCANEYIGKDVLVVGAGNSGMEIACDLCEHGARNVAIVIRSQIHIVSREILRIAIALSRFLSLRWLNVLVLLMCYLKFGNLSSCGIRRPEKGPFYFKAHVPIHPVVDVGTAARIKSGDIKVLGAIESICKDKVIFEDGTEHCFDAIVFATGYRSCIRNWLKDDGDDLIGDDGMAKNKYPDHWKGRNGLYCAGLARRGLYGSSKDAQSIASDIRAILKDT